MLQKGAEYITQLRGERNQLKDEIESLKQQIQMLKTSIRYSFENTNNDFKILSKYYYNNVIISVIVNPCYLRLERQFQGEVIVKCKKCSTTMSEIVQWKTGNFGLYPFNCSFLYVIIFVYFIQDSKLSISQK